MDRVPFEGVGELFDDLNDERVSITEYVPQRAEEIKTWLSTLTADWQQVNGLDLWHSDRDSAIGLGLCICSGLAQRRRLIDVYSQQMSCVVLEATETGNCNETHIFKFAERLWSLANTTSPRPEWQVKLTAEGCQAANDIASGTPNALSFACNYATFKKADPDVRMRIVGTPDASGSGGAFAAAQAVATVVINNAPHSSREQTAAPSSERFTSPMTVADIAKAFKVHRNTISPLLDGLGAEKFTGSLYRMPVSKMPAEWLKAHGLI